MPFITSVSAHRTIHQSKAESDTGDRLIPQGFLVFDQDLPVQYTCPEGILQTGRSDFLDSVFGILIESKANTLNCKKTKTTADRGIARLEDQIADGWIERGSNKHRLGVLRSGWNHAAAQIAAKQRACFASGFVYVLLFSRQPDDATLKLLKKYDILWLHEKSPEWVQFLTWRTLAGIPGVTVQTLRIKEWSFTLH